MAPKRRPPEERFREYYVVAESGCWMWISTIEKDGYGQFFDGVYLRGDHRRPRIVRAHRFSYELHVGSIPKGKLVLHECDVRPCVNPKHLFVGTHVENMADMKAKGRATGPGLGEKHPRAKLTNAKVLRIRKMRDQGKGYDEIGKKLGISRQHARKVGAGLLWGHVK